MAYLRTLIKSYMQNRNGSAMMRYAIWVTICTMTISIISVTSADYIVSVVKEDAQFQQAAVEEEEAFPTGDVSEPSAFTLLLRRIFD